MPGVLGLYDSHEEADATPSTHGGPCGLPRSFLLESSSKWARPREIEGTEPSGVVTRFRRSNERQFSFIAGEAPNTETRLEALIKLEVACRLALELLPKLPIETQEALRGPTQTL